MNALITGASNGIGLELAHQCAQNKINVLLVARDQHALDIVAQKIIEKYGVQAKTIAMDLSERDAADRLYKKVTEMQWGIDYLINDAGFGDFGIFAEADWKKQEAMIALNITTLTHLCRLFLPGMISRKQGKVLNLASIAAFLPGPFMSVYYATKAYVLSFSQALNNELKGTGVTVTALCPGPTQTNFEHAANAGASNLFKRKLPSADEVAHYGFQAMMKGRSVAIHGVQNKVLIFMTRLVSHNALTWISRKAAKG